MVKNIRLEFMVFSLLLIILNASMAIAQAPGDYDLNTEITLSGVIVEIPDGSRGPQRFLLKSGDRIYQAITGPRWYLWEIGLALSKGENVKVTGSKMFDREGNLLLILYSLKDLDTGKLFKFRDENIRPLWSGRGKRMRK